MPSGVSKFAATWPTVRLQVQEVLDDPHLLSGIERGELDVCFDVQPLPSGPFETRDLVRDPYVLVCATTSPLVGPGQRPTAANLAGLPMVG
jgi:DNA-binding transcriptional LysR family regulator